MTKRTLVSLLIFAFLLGNIFSYSPVQAGETVESLKKQVKVLQANVKTLQGQIKTLSGKVSTSNKEIAKLKKEKTSLENLNKTLKSELTALGKGDRALLVSILTSKKVYEGTVNGTRESWPYKLKFTHYDPKTGELQGSIEWPTLNSINLVKGKIAGNQIVFSETDYVKKGDSLLDSTYIVAFDKTTNKLTGYWYHVSDHGDIEIVIK
jgi:cell division protein FtsB